MKKYDHKKIERKWQKYWSAKKIYKTKEGGEKPKCYVLDMFPYLSGEGLHVGHPRGYIATDVYSRFKRMNGFNVLHPMGFDSFGLPAENYAIKNKIHPEIAVKNNVKKFKGQLGLIGFDYDWDREIITSDPNFYKWTQWIFLKMFEKGLAYESYEPINFCPSCLTGLANEDVEDGKCERCGTAVIKKPMRQWVLKITDYAERLLGDLEELKNWPEHIKEAQRNWIGKSEGATVRFKLFADGRFFRSVEIFTTRIDTIFGCTYLVVAPESKIIEELKGQIKNWGEVEKYIGEVKNKSDLQRTDLAKEKTGVELKGVKAISPANGENLPVFVADYVLGGYGTGAVMAVPAHDERDFEFSQKYGLPLRQVIRKLNAPIRSYLMGAKNISEQDLKKIGVKIYEITKDGDYKIEIPKSSLEQYEKFINERLEPFFWNEYISDDVVFIFKHKDGKVERLVASDKNIERIDRLACEFNNQKYNPNDPGNYINGALARNDWYKPLIVHTELGVLINSGEFDGLDFKTAREKMTKWLEERKLGGRKINYKLKDWVFSRQRYWGEPIPLIHCENCGVVAVPEKDLPVELPKVKFYEPTDTGESPLAKMEKWVNVKCPKCGGKGKRETNTMPQWAGSSWYYLAYIMRGISNFQFPISKYKKVLQHWLPVDMYVGGTEHATRHLIYARFWHKFLYDIGIVGDKEPFASLKNQGLIMGNDGRKMSKRWGNIVSPDDVINQFGADSLRLYEMFMGPFDQPIPWDTRNIVGVKRFLERVWKMQEKFQITKTKLQTNYKNQITNSKLERLLHQTIKKVTDDIENFRFNTAISSLMILLNEMEKEPEIFIFHFSIFLKLLSPFAPHLTEEIWQSVLGHKTSINLEKWPVFDEEKIKEKTFKLVVQIDGKTRDLFEIPAGISEDEAKDLTLKRVNVKKWVGDKRIEKIIYVPNKIINIVL